MTKEKQIEEMAQIIADNTEFDTMWSEINASAEALYNAGYRKQSEWISVEERLPESRKFVIACDEYGNVGEAYFFPKDGRFEWIDDEEIAFATHWMPFPEAPKMKGGAE